MHKIPMNNWVILHIILGNGKIVLGDKHEKKDL